MQLNLKILRFDPEEDKEPYYEIFRVAADPLDRILDLLNRIRWEQDPSLAYRMSCGHGICGSDGMRINGVSSLACQKLAKEFKEDDEVLIEPLQVFPVMKDLVVDQSRFFEKYYSVKPYLITRTAPPDKERLQSIEDREKLEDATRCILCACCTASCPVNQQKQTENYVGPAALVRAYRFVFDSRDEARTDRLSMLDRGDGAWGCKTYWWCTRVCPKKIPVTKEIAALKKSIFDEKKRTR